MMQNVCFKMFSLRLVYQWKTIPKTSVLITLFLCPLCYLFQRFVYVFIKVLYQQEKTYEKPKKFSRFFCLFFIFLLFQAKDSSEQLNLILPGSLLPFKQQIGKMFEKELEMLCKKSRFEKVFRNIKIKPVFTNRTNVKQLIVKTKINWTKAYELWLHLHRLFFAR